ncbi:MAG TPA: hypothetical protein VJW20_15360 [Candidatus Angelobacter sp.]|nr:hypothetical protein [Candidatus Angelobacter sp.]
MAISSVSFANLFKQIKEVNLFGTAPPTPPADKTKAVKGAGGLLPLLYRNTYLKALEPHLPKLVQQAKADADSASFVETLAGAVYQHDDARHRPNLQRFLAVISDLYRSFLSHDRRTRANFPLRETIPPLAVFQHEGDQGPFTLPCDDVSHFIGSNVGVVSLPATYRDHPVLWAALAHETGGHDVLHADNELLPELRSGVHQLFGHDAFGNKMGLLWDYWMDEAASDVYGVLNIGPSFGLNLAVFFAALNAEAARTDTPLLRSDSGADPSSGSLDPHPTDVLRLPLIVGAVQTLVSLSEESKKRYSSDLKALVHLLAPGVQNVRIEGAVPQQLAGPVMFNDTFPIDDMSDAAARVGAYIATVKLEALGGHSIQELETWDDTDESTASRVATLIQNGKNIANVGDDAHTLAGATLAAYADSANYLAINKLVNQALDASFAQDPYWRKPQRDFTFLKNDKMRALSLQKVEKPAFQADPLAQEIIEHDSAAEEAAGLDFGARKILHPIPWPASLVPKPQPPHTKPRADVALGRYDYLVVTWTVDEARALADVLTPGFPSHSAWFDYSHEFEQKYAKKIRNGAPASKSHKLGSFFPMKIGDSSVLCFKSELHMSQDGPDLPIKDLWEQLIAEVKPKLVITTGTAGGIGSKVELGDVIVTNQVRFDCTKSFAREPWAHELFRSKFQMDAKYFAFANQNLLGANAEQLPPAKRKPEIFENTAPLGEPDVVVTTDFFAFDDNTNFYDLQGKGAAVEMGDAVLGLVAEDLGASAPPYLVIRNASDPQIGGKGTIQEKRTEGANIYKQYGYWTTVCSAIGCWAAVLAHAGVPIPAPKRARAQKAGS